MVEEVGDGVVELHAVALAAARNTVALDVAERAVNPVDTVAETIPVC